MNDRIPEDKPTRVPAGANRWWNQPRAIDLEGTERLRAIRGACAKSARLLEREPTDWKAGCGRSARPVWREGWSQNSTPTPIQPNCIVTAGSRFWRKKLLKLNVFFDGFVNKSLSHARVLRSEHIRKVVHFLVCPLGHRQSRMVCLLYTSDAAD